MLLAILDQLKQRLPEARHVVNPGSAPYSWRAKLGLYQLFDPQQSGRLGWLRARLFHQGYRQRFGLVPPDQIDAILDASGYALGDAWMPEHIEHTATQFERYKKLGARIILLPQAFGPYENARIRKASARILEAADLVFARDLESLAYCKTIVSDDSAIHQAPDFTTLLQGTLPSCWTVNPKDVAVVPNRKMLSESDPITVRSYVPILAKAVQIISDAGYHPFVLVHEINDTELAKEIVQVCGVKCPVIDEPNSLAVKGILGSCAFTIGSRFHGQVSALSQGIPCIGTAWSHKYLQLFQEYGIPDWLCALDDEGNSFFKQLDRLLVAEERRELTSRLRQHASVLHWQADNSWKLVASKLGHTA